MTPEIEDDDDEFLVGLATYFTKYIFTAVNYEVDAEIPFDDMRRAINQASGETGDILKMFCGID